MLHAERCDTHVVFGVAMSMGSRMVSSVLCLS